MGWGRKDWLREGIGQLWRVSWGEGYHREDGVKELLMRRGLSERKGIVLGRDREASGKMVYGSK